MFQSLLTFFFGRGAVQENDIIDTVLSHAVLFHPRSNRPFSSS